MNAFGHLLGRTFAAILLTAALFLSACDTAEERAEAHYQAGLAHLENGDVERALIEFKNVFKLNGQHKEARLTFARLERERGNVPLAYRQYLLLVEQYPDNLEGNRALAEMALEQGLWEDLRRYVTKAAQLAPEEAEIASLQNTLAYTDAVRDGNDAGIGQSVAAARAMLDDRPDMMTARHVVIDHLVRAQDWYDVIDQVDAALAFAPTEGNLYTIRLHALQQLGKTDEIEKQLRQMIDVFPGDQGVEQMLVEHFIDQRRLDDAEEILRAKADPLSEDYFPVQRLIAFLTEHRGHDAAIAEMTRTIAAGGPHAARYRMMRAALRFQSGDTDGALAEMRALLDGALRTAQTRENEVEFARMLILSGDRDEGRAVIERVLSEDPTQTEAVKLKAAWLIEDDAIGDAILLLRAALETNARDPQLVTLMAQAHDRNGDRNLKGEMLALAVELSDNAPTETLNYAQHLIEENDLKIAESVLIDALRKAPTDPRLLLTLGDVYVALQDWPRLESVLQALEPLDDPDTRRKASELKAQMLEGQNRTGDLAAFLGDLAQDPEFGLPADLALIRLMVIQNDLAGAEARLDTLLAEEPESNILRIVKAHVLEKKGEPDAAVQLYRAIVADDPGSTRAWLGLIALQKRHEDPQQVRATVQQALTALPDNADLLMLQAEGYEWAGEWEAAIAAYEKAYTASNRSPVVANNLASLLTTRRHDDDSLQRAQILVRSLRGSRVPAFQDTYGWVAYRLGNYDEALTYLESAAQGLPDHPVVLQHLGKAYEAVGRKEDALRVFQAAQSGEAAPDVVSDIEAEIERLRIELNGGQ